MKYYESSLEAATAVRRWERQLGFIQSSPYGHAQVESRTHPRRTVLDMVTAISEMMRSFGGAGAIANARRACDERIRVHAELELQLERVTPVAALWPGEVEAAEAA